MKVKKLLEQTVRAFHISWLFNDTRTSFKIKGDKCYYAGVKLQGNLLKTYFENEDAVCWQTRKIRSQMLILIERTRFLAVMESILKKHRKNRYQKLNKHLDKITKQIEKEKEEDKAFQELVKELETDELI